MSFYLLWKKDHDNERPSTVNIPNARDVSYHSALVVPEDLFDKRLYDKDILRDPQGADVKSMMSEMLLACLQARHALPHLEYFHIAKLGGYLRMACDSKAMWFGVLQSFKYRTNFERRIPDLLLMISDFEDNEEAPKLKDVERRKIQLLAYVGSLRTGELLKLMKTCYKPLK